MTKRNFEAIANILAGDYAISTPIQRQRVFGITLSLADYFLRENPNFDRSKFYAAVFGESNPHLVAADFSLAGK